MKPEEIDNLFRYELEKLNSIPDLEWNDAAAWNKINVNLKGGWSNSWTWGISVITILVSISSYFLLSLDKGISPTPKATVINYIKNPVRKDTVLMPGDSKKSEEIQESTRALPVSEDSSLIKVNDTIAPVALTTDSVKEYSRSNIPLKKEEFHADPDFKFSIPSMSYLKLKVNDGFNFSNLSKSLKAQKDAEGQLYYFYEYNNSVPPAYRNTSPGYMNRNTQTITNFNK